MACTASATKKATYARAARDPAVEEIWNNQPGRVFVLRHGRPELTTVVLTGDQVRDLVERMLKPSGRRLDLSKLPTSHMRDKRHTGRLSRQSVGQPSAAVLRGVGPPMRVSDRDT